LHDLDTRLTICVSGTTLNGRGWRIAIRRLLPAVTRLGVQLTSGSLFGSELLRTQNSWVRHPWGRHVAPSSWVQDGGRRLNLRRAHHRRCRDSSQAFQSKTGCSDKVHHEQSEGSGLGSPSSIIVKGMIVRTQTQQNGSRAVGASYRYGSVFERHRQEACVAGELWRRASQVLKFCF
jgi:hypothetical protein